MDTEVLKATLQIELDALSDAGQELWLHAAHADANVRTALHRLDLRFQLARAEFTRLAAQTGEARDEILKNLRLLIDELRQGYARIAQQS